MLKTGERRQLLKDAADQSG